MCSKNRQIINYSFKKMTDIFQKPFIDSEFLLNHPNILNKQQFVLVKRACTEQRIRIFPWTTIEDLKNQVASMFNSPSITHQDIRLFHKNIQLIENDKNIHDFNIVGNGAITMEIRKSIENSNKPVINPYKLFRKSEKNVKKLLHKTIESLQNGKNPQLTNQGTSGAYIIQNSKKQKIAIFKPFDEEVNAPNNPRGKAAPLGSDGICKGILSGQCATRQVAAYLLDSNGNRFHSVPTTTYIQFYHPSLTNNKEPILNTPIPSSKQNYSLSKHITKHGSLQQFVESKGVIADFGLSLYTNQEIQKIAILDIRILNCDRNDENVLVQENSDKGLKLIPIDHGLSFPDNFEIYQDYIFWMNLPQSKQPLSSEQLKFINQIDPVEDVKTLSEKLGFRKICLRNFRIAQTFLKKTANLGFTLYEMGKMLYRNDDDDDDNYHSFIQKVVLQAQNLYENKKVSIFELSDSDEDELDDTAETMPPLKQLNLKKKISLPQLIKRTTSFHQRKYVQRKSREGINGVGKTIWNKYQKQQWSEEFYHYFQDLLDTSLKQKMKQKK